MLDQVSSLDAAQPLTRDGRARYRERNHSRLLAATRLLMSEGVFRPTINRIAERAELTLRTAYNHFASAADAWEEALDEMTAAMILHRLMPNGPWPASDDCSRIVRAAVWGRLSS